MTNPVDPAAPHGRDAAGNPLTPFGINVDGTPRKSNRGARAGQKGNRQPTTTSRRGKTATPTLSTSSLTDDDRRNMLCELADMVIVTPLASASQAPFITARIGPKQADALAGDAFILNQFAPNIADGLIVWSKTKPSVLSWMDKLEGNAALVMLTGALIQAGKAFAENHINPNPNLAAAGRTLASMRMSAMADKVLRDAAAMRQPAQDPFANAETLAGQRAFAEQN